MKDTAPQFPADEEPADDPLRMVRGKHRLLRLLKRSAEAARAKQGQADCRSLRLYHFFTRASKLARHVHWVISLGEESKVQRFYFESFQLS